MRATAVRIVGWAIPTTSEVPMRLRCQLLLACCVAVLPVSRGKAQSPPPATAPDSTRQILHTKDGSTLYGRIVAEDSSTVQFETSGGTLKIERSNIASIKPVHQSDMHDGEYWHPDPNRTRLFVGPTGRLLDGGDGYYQNTYALLQTLVVAPSNRFNLGGGFTLIPGVDPTAWAYYVNPKIGVYQSENVNVAVGGYAGFQPEGDVDGFGFGYGVATFGGLDGNVSGGVGFGRAGKSNSNPVFMLSGSQRISRRLAVMT